MLTDKQKSRLLQIAHDSIETYLKTGKHLHVEESDPALKEQNGAFVTLHKGGKLCGCIGSLKVAEPLYLTIRDMAVEAATGDPRFVPVELSELAKIKIEISVLSVLKRVFDAEQIQIGVHGVLVKKGICSGVFLPQVAKETGWSKEEFLSNLCSGKAGLNPCAWKEQSCELYIFTAEVFP